MPPKKRKEPAAAAAAVAGPEHIDDADITFTPEFPELEDVMLPADDVRLVAENELSGFEDVSIDSGAIGA